MADVQLVDAETAHQRAAYALRELHLAPFAAELAAHHLPLERTSPLVLAAVRLHGCTPLDAATVERWRKLHARITSGGVDAEAAGAADGAASPNSVLSSPQAHAASTPPVHAYTPRVRARSRGERVVQHARSRAAAPLAPRHATSASAVGAASAGAAAARLLAP